LSEFLLIRHAVNDFVKTGKLAGWTPGVHLNELGRAQASALGERLAYTRIDALYTSPLERTVETAQAVLEHHPNLQMQLLEDIGEVRYGAWQGAELGTLMQRKLWRNVQLFPSRVRFPGGEAMREAQRRAVNAIETLNERHPRETVAVVSHSDIIKMIVAHYLGMHLDMFQRIEIGPASLSILRLGGWGRPFLVQINETTYLREPNKETPDERKIDEIRPVKTIMLDAIGEPGHRTFYLQVAGEQIDPVTFVLEKPQAAMLAAQIYDLLSGQEFQAAELPALIAPERVMFRVGKFALQYDSDQACLTLEAMPGTGQETPRTFRLWVTFQQVKALADHTLQVVQRGRQHQS
jgi:probable phosphoglycerate mutase